MATSLAEAGEELLTFYCFPAGQHKSLRATSASERLQEEFRQRVKTQASLLVFFVLFARTAARGASSQMKMPRIAGWFDLSGTGAEAA